MGLTKTVVSMSDSSFAQAYEQMFSGNVSTVRTRANASKKQTKALLKNIADVSSETYKQIDSILEKYVYDKDTVDSNKVKIEFKRDGLYDLIQKYLKENPYVDKSVFGL